MDQATMAIRELASLLNKKLRSGCLSMTAVGDTLGPILKYSKWRARISSAKRLVFALPFLGAPLAGAGVVNIGLISFDVLSPNGSSPKVNVAISNLTGS